MQAVTNRTHEATPAALSRGEAVKKEKAVAVSKAVSKANKPIHYPFWFGGSASCMAACVTHPLDLSELPFLLGSCIFTLSYFFFTVPRGSGSGSVLRTVQQTASCNKIAACDDSPPLLSRSLTFADYPPLQSRYGYRCARATCQSR